MGKFPTGPTLVAKQRAVKTSFARKEREREREEQGEREKEREKSNMERPKIFTQNNQGLCHHHS
jgi:hypothetical protein